MATTGEQSMAEGPERSLLHVHGGLGCAHNFETYSIDGGVQ
jgi:hypothetical protein